MTTVADAKTMTRVQWDAAAAGWDQWFLWYERTFAPVMDWCCEAADIRPGRRVLDVACGSGLPARGEALRARPARVTATDIAPAMLDVARRRAAERAIGNVEVVEMDAEHLLFADETFDAVSCAYALMFYPDPVRAVAEAHRVLKPGGRFVCVVWDRPESNPMLTAAGQAVAQFFPSQASGANAPGAFRYADPAALASVLRAGGLHDVCIERREVVAEFGSANEYWQMFTEMAAGIKAKIAPLSARDRAQLETLVAAHAAPFVADSGLRLPAVSLCAVAQA